MILTQLAQNIDATLTRITESHLMRLYWFSENRNFAFERVAKF